MAEYKTIPLEKIDVRERMRAVDEDHARAIAASIADQGLISPVTVRFVPANQKGARPYILVAGAHRIRATEINGAGEIECLVVKADQDEARLLEIAENLIRNELSKLDRALAVLGYRETWEAKHGKIEPGNPNWGKLRQLVDTSAGDQRGKLHLWSELDQSGDSRGFSAYVAERLGLSKDAVKRAQRIATHLAPALRLALRFTPVADNQAQLMALTRLARPEQERLAARIMSGTEAAQAVEQALAGPEKPGSGASEQAYQRVLGNWGRLNRAHKWQALTDLGITDILTDEQRELLEQRFAGQTHA